MTAADMKRIQRDAGDVKNGIDELCDEIELLRAELESARDTIAIRDNRITELEAQATP